MSPVSLSTTAFAHSVGVMLAMVMSLLAVMVVMACSALFAVVGPTRRAEIASLMCRAVRPG
jgi:hypothetical protein